MSNDTELALANLGLALRVAADARPRFAESELNGERLDAIAALLGCCDLIDSFADWRAADLARPLKELAAALDDLNNGYVSPTLKPKAVKHRPVSARKSTFRGQAAAIMGGLMAHGHMSEEDAGKWVAKRLKNAAGWSHVTGITIENWRKEATEKPRSNAGERYSNALSRADWTDPVQRANQLIRNLVAPAAPKKSR